ncbi:hypothetical protein [Spongiactinospora rosea]|uniref:hypothetical protein n=1 Tax=Spongiactinospora rosea TaxID=2248750 RepID=UPI0011C06CC0|nr:hypothetical protein [Spongiactinospora rosea]
MQEALAAQHMGKVLHAFRTHHYHGRRIPQSVACGWLYLTQTQISRIETGPPMHDLHRLTQVAHILGIPAHLLWFAPSEEEEPQDAADPTNTNAEPIPDDNVWQAMSALLRRTFLKGGLATVTPSLFGLEHGTSSAPRIPEPPPTSWADAIYTTVLNPTDAARQAATTWGGELSQQQNTLSVLRQATAHAVRVSLASDYGELAETLPLLIGKVELAHIQANGEGEPSAQQLSSDVYAVAGWTLIKADSPIAAWLAANRAIQAAEAACDALRAAAATRCLAEVYMRAGNFEEATRTAFLAATYLDTAPRNAPRKTVLCLRGAALLSAAAASARREDRREAHIALKAAAACAWELAEDRADFGTVFGPTNVAIHKVAIPIELGNAREAIEHVPEVNLARMPRLLSERRSRFLIDVARSHAALKSDSAALAALLEAENIAPDELRHHRLTHSVVRNLLARERRSSDVRALAARCNLLD